MFLVHFLFALLTVAYVLKNVSFVLRRRGFVRVDFWHVLLYFRVVLITGVYVKRY